MDSSYPHGNQPRKGKGRQKVDIVKMQNETNLQVTFSKRRNGLFKKASELTSRCGAESAVVVFSPGEKPYSFGHPTAETIAARYLGQTNSPQRMVRQEQFFDGDYVDANMELDQVDGQVEAEKNQGKDLHEVMKQACASNGWTPIPDVGSLNIEKLDFLKGTVIGFKQDFDKYRQDSSGFGDPYFPGPNPNPNPNSNPNPNVIYSDQNLQWLQATGNSSCGLMNYGTGVQPEHGDSFYNGLGAAMFGYNPATGVSHFASPFMPMIGSTGYVIPYNTMTSDMNMGGSSRVDVSGDPDCGTSSAPTTLQGNSNYTRKSSK